MASPVPKNDRFSAQLYWCLSCHVPVITTAGQVDPQTKKSRCPLCGAETGYIASDLRPVFPEERLLLELLLGKNPNELAEKSVWAENSRYYIEGKSLSVSSKIFREADTDGLASKIKDCPQNKFYLAFERLVEKFTRANRGRFDFIKDDATSFINRTTAAFYERQGFTKEQQECAEQVFVSFSGGKDSTVTSDLVMKALSNPNVTHVFGNTTLEFPSTVEYAERYRKGHPLVEFRTAKNYEQNFYDVCDDIGPPARMMRWCCSMFKTGPIARVIHNKFGDKQILTFYGIRSCESVARSKYSQVTEEGEQVKIQKQTVASPIFNWKDIDVWLYLLTEKVDFNDAYRLGYDRVGCWCCPNNNQRAQFLSRIYMAEESKRWRGFLLDFAKKIGKPDAEEYVDSGAWKARQGGNGLPAAADVKLQFASCTSEEHAKIYQLTHPYNEDFLNMLVPFGKIATELGRRLLHESLVLDVRGNIPIIAVQPFNQEGFEHAVKIKTMNVKDHEGLQRKIGYQVRKFNACRSCLKCESVCHSDAISINGGEYRINPDKCVHCLKCVTEKYLTGGCMMEKYLRTRTDYKI